MERRNFLTRMGLALTGALAAKTKSIEESILKISNEKTMSSITRTSELGFQWETRDPFLFCVHHEDYFPKGNEQMGPANDLLKGRHMGDDFIIKDGFRMYHGKVIPGFPGHPHRGFETITVVRRGIVDHADSLGAAGRYGNGDVQWMTAGKGVQHSEMFPLIHSDKENTMELFQIWLNLPKKNKMVEPHFKMLWRENIPNHEIKNANGKKINIEVIAGKLFDKKPQTPPPDSWAAGELNEVAVWNIKMQAGSSFTLPAASKNVNRTLYFYEGDDLKINEQNLKSSHLAEVIAEHELHLICGSKDASILVLQGKPISEPVIQYGPFVMNTKAEINQAFEDYHQTQFGGWPWPRYDQVHERNKTRFAKHADGKLEVKGV